MHQDERILWLRVVVRIIYRPGHVAGHRRKWSLKAVFLSMRVIALPVGAFLFSGIQHPKLAPIAIARAAAKEKSFAVPVARPGENLYIGWKRDAPAIRDAASGELIIWDAAAGPRVFLLTTDELHRGSVLYLDAANQVRPRLFAIGRNSGFSEIPVSIGADKPAE